MRYRIIIRYLFHIIILYIPIAIRLYLYYRTVLEGKNERTIK